MNESSAPVYVQESLGHSPSWVTEQTFVCAEATIQPAGSHYHQSWFFSSNDWGLKGISREEIYLE